MNHITKCLYLEEIWSISEQIKILENDFNSHLDEIEIDEKNIFGQGHHIIRMISSILAHTARLNKLFQADSKRDNEDDSDYENRVARVEFLRQEVFNGKQIGQSILSSKVRNAIEHFDSRVDEIEKRVNLQDIKLNNLTICAYAVIKSHKFFKDDGWERILPLKVYVHDIKTFYLVDENLDKVEINLDNLFSDNNNLNVKIAEVCNSTKEKTGPCAILKAHPHSEGDWIR